MVINRLSLSLTLASSIPLMAACSEADQAQMEAENSTLSSSENPAAVKPETKTGDKQVTNGEDAITSEQAAGDPKTEETAKTQKSPLAEGWQSRGFEQLPADYVWYGGGSSANDTYAVLGVPETDDQVFSAGCTDGAIDITLFLFGSEPKLGVSSAFQAEVEGQQTHELSVKAKPYGEGLANGFRLPLDHPLFAEMASGEWVYWQVDSDDSRGKVRVSLAGAAPHIERLIAAC